MRILTIFSVWLATVFFFDPSAVASEVQLKLPGLFGDGMVLQQQSDAPVWGWAKAGATVTVTGSWDGAKQEAVASETGEWRVKLKTPKAGGPFQILVESGKESRKVKDVMSGEVWICSGQSNMQWKMRGFGVAHFKEDVDKANRPNIRLFEVPQVLALEEQGDVKAKWRRCNPQTVMSFSAVAYFFGAKLDEELDVPIGLISTSWGGSTAEAWASAGMLSEKFPEFDGVMKGYPAITAESGGLYSRANRAPRGTSQISPAVLYNGMLRPLIPFAIRGVIWYQGETNVPRPVQYRKLFPAMIQDWRSKWGQGDFPFYYVQIAPFSYKTERKSAAFLREAQMMALSEPETGMVVTMDLGDKNSIHPKKKKPVGERLAMLALKRDYGRQDLVATGPIYQDSKVEGNQVRLAFTDLGGGLAVRGGGELTHFKIAGADQKFFPAKAVIDGKTIVVSSAKVAKPVAVRFAWGSGDEPNLMNKEGLPVSSFRTDEWPVR